MSGYRAIINLDPAEPVEYVTGGSRTTVVGVADGAQAVRAALDLVADGVDSFELCGGFGPLAAAPVIEAIGGRVPAGLVLFGMESLTTVAAYKARAEAGEQLAGAFVFLQEGADPQAEPVVREHAGGRGLFAAVPDEAAAPAVAAGLRERYGAQLVELYGGFSPSGVAKVVEAVDAAIPVGVASYALPGR